METALWIAASHGDIISVRSLVEAGADVNILSWTDKGLISILNAAI